MYNYVLRLVGDRAQAEDLTQEVFLRVFQGLPRFSLRSKFTTWLFQVTKNRVLDELRASERRPRAVVALEDVPPLEVVDAPMERLEAIDAYEIDAGEEAPETGLLTGPTTELPEQRAERESDEADLLLELAAER